MKKEIENKQQFDLSMVKNPVVKKVAEGALYTMMLTLTPQLFICYYQAICRSDYKVAMKVLLGVQNRYTLKNPDHVLPQVGDEQGQMLLESLLYDMHRCTQEYNGGFLYGIIDELHVVAHSPEHEILLTFMVQLFNRMNAYVCQD